jgi:hypothetical protein
MATTTMPRIGSVSVAHCPSPIVIAAAAIFHLQYRRGCMETYESAKDILIVNGAHDATPIDFPRRHDGGMEDAGFVVFWPVGG